MSVSAMAEKPYYPPSAMGEASVVPNPRSYSFLPPVVPNPNAQPCAHIQDSTFGIDQLVPKTSAGSLGVQAPQHTLAHLKTSPRGSDRVSARNLFRRFLPKAFRRQDKVSEIVWETSANNRDHITPPGTRMLLTWRPAKGDFVLERSDWIHYFLASREQDRPMSPASTAFEIENVQETCPRCSGVIPRDWIESWLDSLNENPCGKHNGENVFPGNDTHRLRSRYLKPPLSETSQSRSETSVAHSSIQYTEDDHFPKRICTQCLESTSSGDWEVRCKHARLEVQSDFHESHGRFDHIITTSDDAKSSRPSSSSISPTTTPALGAFADTRLTNILSSTAVSDYKSTAADIEENQSRSIPRPSLLDRNILGASTTVGTNTMSESRFRDESVKPGSVSRSTDGKTYARSQPSTRPPSKRLPNLPKPMSRRDAFRQRALEDLVSLPSSTSCWQTDYVSSGTDSDASADTALLHLFDDPPEGIRNLDRFPHPPFVRDL